MGFLARRVLVKELKSTMDRLRQSPPDFQEYVHRGLKEFMADRDQGKGGEHAQLAVYQSCAGQRQDEAARYGDFTKDWFVYSLCETVCLCSILHLFRNDTKTAAALKEVLDPFVVHGR